MEYLIAGRNGWKATINSTVVLFDSQAKLLDIDDSFLSIDLINRKRGLIKKLKKGEIKQMREHKTADGRQIPISAMTDEHLINTIKMKIEGVKSAKKVLDTDITLSRSQRAMMGIKDFENNITEEAEKTLNRFHSSVAEYYLELVIRGDSIKVEAITNEIKELVGRKERINLDQFYYPGSQTRLLTNKEINSGIKQERFNPFDNHINEDDIPF